MEAVRSHVAAHECAEPAQPGLETWLEQGLPFKAEDTCPFCGQELRDRRLLEAYSRFFSEAYRKLAEDVQKLRQTCQHYSNGDFRNAAEQVSKSNDKQFEYWQEAAGVDAPATIDLEALISGMEHAAAKMDSSLQTKAANLTVALDVERLGAAIDAWSSARAAIESAKAALGEYNHKVDIFNRLLKKDFAPALWRKSFRFRPKKARNSGSRRRFWTDFPVSGACSRRVSTFSAAC